MWPYSHLQSPPSAFAQSCHCSGREQKHLLLPHQDRLGPRHHWHKWHHRHHHRLQQQYLHPPPPQEGQTPLLALTLELSDVETDELSDSETLVLTDLEAATLLLVEMLVEAEAAASDATTDALADD